MANLFLSFIIAIGGATSIFALSRVFDMEGYTSRILPFIPILYAIIYEFLEKKRSRKEKPAPTAKEKEGKKSAAAFLFPNITVARILIAVGISFAVKILLEIIYTSIFVYVSGKSFISLYGNLNIETIAMFLKGNHPWLTKTEGIHILAIIAFTASLVTGLWIGYTSKGKAILEGVLVGATVTLITAMTNMLALYRKIEEVANQTAASMGYSTTAIGFMAVLTLQVLLYGLWSGLIQQSKIKQSCKKLSKGYRK